MINKSEEWFFDLFFFFFYKKPVDDFIKNISCHIGIRETILKTLCIIKHCNTIIEELEDTKGVNQNP
jgi:hypothetical protein